MKNAFFLLGLLLSLRAMTQPNCNFFLYQGDTAQYRTICPYFAYAYREKSVAYLKSGDFLGWKKLIDLAVKYDAPANLGYRGWCRYQFFRDYQGAIRDIERLDSLINYDLGHSANGDYHLEVARAMCYSALGQKQKARSILEAHLAEAGRQAGLFDHYQLGVTCFELGDLETAFRHFQLQDQRNELAESAYYQALIYRQQGVIADFESQKTKALDLYHRKRMLMDPYTHHFNKVYLEEIEKL
jgi:tetratricopeptide (TPR) repeat protein